MSKPSSFRPSASSPSPAPDAAKPALKGATGLVELVVADLKLDPRDGTAVALLRDRVHNRVFPIWLADAAARALGRARLADDDRESSADSYALLFHAIEALGATVEHVELSDVSRGVVTAQIALFDGERAQVLAARASDAIALACRASAPILCSELLLMRVHARVLEAVSRSHAERHGAAEPMAQSPAERWSQLLAHLSRQNVGKIYEG